MRGNQRTIGFSNCERYFAKGTRGIHGVYPIPELTAGTPNSFLTTLFAAYNAVSAKEQEEAAAEKLAYETAMAQGLEIIESIVDVDSANAAMPRYKELKHALTSNKELSAAWNERIKACGLMFDKVLAKYTPKPNAEGAE